MTDDSGTSVDFVEEQWCLAKNYRFFLHGSTWGGFPVLKIKMLQIKYEEGTQFMYLFQFAFTSASCQKVVVFTFRTRQNSPWPGWALAPHVPWDRGCARMCGMAGSTQDTWLCLSLGYQLCKAVRVHRGGQLCYLVFIIHLFIYTNQNLKARFSQMLSLLIVNQTLTKDLGISHDNIECWQELIIIFMILFLGWSPGPKYKFWGHLCSFRLVQLSVFPESPSGSYVTMAVLARF